MSWKYCGVENADDVVDAVEDDDAENGPSTGRYAAEQREHDGEDRDSELKTVSG